MRRKYREKTNRKNRKLRFYGAINIGFGAPFWPIYIERSVSRPMDIEQMKGEMYSDDTKYLWGIL